MSKSSQLQYQEEIVGFAPKTPVSSLMETSCFKKKIMYTPRTVKIIRISRRGSLRHIVKRLKF